MSQADCDVKRNKVPILGQIHPNDKNYFWKNRDCVLKPYDYDGASNACRTWAKKGNACLYRRCNNYQKKYEPEDYRFDCVGIQDDYGRYEKESPMRKTCCGDKPSHINTTASVDEIETHKKASVVYKLKNRVSASVSDNNLSRQNTTGRTLTLKSSPKPKWNLWDPSTW